MGFGDTFKETADLWDLNEVQHVRQFVQDGVSVDPPRSFFMKSWAVIYQVVGSLSVAPAQITCHGLCLPHQKLVIV